MASVQRARRQSLVGPFQAPQTLRRQPKRHCGVSLHLDRKQPSQHVRPAWPSLVLCRQGGLLWRFRRLEVFDVELSFRVDEHAAGQRASEAYTCRWHETEIAKAHCDDSPPTMPTGTGAMNRSYKRDIHVGAEYAHLGNSRCDADLTSELIHSMRRVHKYKHHFRTSATSLYTT